jgi:hypothetical protein
MEQFTTSEQSAMGKGGNRKLSNKQFMLMGIIGCVIIALLTGLFIWYNGSKERDYILPVGSVVRLKNGDMKLVIVGRGQLYDNDGTIGYFDYAALAYPAGLVGEDEYAFFNDEDIAKVYFEGYRDASEKQFIAEYEEEIKKVPYPKLSVDGVA